MDEVLGFGYSAFKDEKSIKNIEKRKKFALCDLKKTNLGKVSGKPAPVEDAQGVITGKSLMQRVATLDGFTINGIPCSLSVN